MLHQAATAAPIGPLQRKLRKAIEPQADSQDTLAALRELSTCYHDNSVQARRGLRSTIEQRGLQINRRLLGAFEALQAQLEAERAEKVKPAAEGPERVEKERVEKERVKKEKKVKLY